MAEEEVFAVVDFWGVHSSKDNQPLFRGWGKTKEEAEKRLEEIRRDDGDAQDDEYWVVQMTEDELERCRAEGVIPEDV